jgi:hypothetical protein
MLADYSVAKKRQQSLVKQNDLRTQVGTLAPTFHLSLPFLYVGPRRDHQGRQATTVVSSSGTGKMAQRVKVRWWHRRETPRRCACPPMGGRIAIEWLLDGALHHVCSYKVEIDGGPVRLSMH